MDENNNVAGAGEAPVASDIVERTAGGEGPLTPREAARSLVDTRAKERAGARRRDDDDQPADAARDGAPAAEELASQEAGTAQQAIEQTAERAGPGETQADDREAALPSIEPPRSWTKEDKDLFRGLPRDTQQRLAERERSREGDFLRRQNEAAEKLKGLSAQQQAAEHARAQYEGALPMLLQTLQEQQAGAFADIQSVADLEKMAREDWPRYVQWDAQQKKIAAVTQHFQVAQARQSHEAAQQWHTFVADEDARFRERAPELADREALAKAARTATDMLQDLGFSQAELGEMWNGGRGVSLRDHRLQLLIRDGVRFRDAQAAAKKPLPRPVPDVQRPGPAPARNADTEGRVKDLTERLNASGNLRDAAALLVARRTAQRR
jgi:hypothetical protein